MGMDHVSLTVRDVEKSIEFYSKALGMRLLRKSIVNPAPGIKYTNAFVQRSPSLGARNCRGCRLRTPEPRKLPEGYARFDRDHAPGRSS